jgi:hypothetical protein
VRLSLPTDHQETGEQPRQQSICLCRLLQHNCTKYNTSFCTGKITKYDEGTKLLIVNHEKSSTCGIGIPDYHNMFDIPTYPKKAKKSYLCDYSALKQLLLFIRQ